MVPSVATFRILKNAFEATHEKGKTTDYHVDAVDVKEFLLNLKIVESEIDGEPYDNKDDKVLVKKFCNSMLSLDKQTLMHFKDIIVTMFGLDKKAFEKLMDEIHLDSDDGESDDEIEGGENAIEMTDIDTSVLDRGQKPVEKDFPFLDAFYDHYEYVLVFPMMGPDQSKYDPAEKKFAEQSNHAKFCIKRMLEAGFQIYTFLSVQGDELFVLFTITEAQLNVFAHEINFKLRLDETYCKNMLSRGDPKSRIKPIKIADEVRFSSLHPYEYIYGKYVKDGDQNLYQSGENGSFITSSVKLKLIFNMLIASKRKGGCRLDIRSMLLKQQILAFYPRHVASKQQNLMRYVWIPCYMPWSMPFDDLKEYLGEKLTLFYVWTGHQSTWLIVPAFVGCVVQAVVWYSGPNYSHPILPFFSIFVCIWAVLMIRHWERKESYSAMKWGMSDFEASELDRPEFNGDLITSPIDGKFMLWYPPHKKRLHLIFSQSVILSMILVVIGSVSGIYVARFSLQNELGVYAAAAASFANTIQITLFNLGYTYYARILNDSENHRSDTQYEDELVIKLFLFQFVNSYISFFYMAFIAPWLSPSPEQPIGYQGQCGYYNCMGPLSINLAIIYGSRLTSNNILEALLDWYYYYCKWSTETSDISSDRYVSPPETEYFLLEMDTMNASIELFADSAIQFGFSILFITALPVSLLATLVSNYIRVKICTWKIMYWYQRPIPRGGQDIGTWKYIFFIICFIGVITNGALICFTMDTLKKESETNESLMSDVSKPDDYDHAELNLVGRMGVWFGFMFAILGIQLVLCWAIPSVPEIVNIQIGRMDFIVSKIIEHEEDDDYDDDNDALQFLGDVQDDNDIEESGPCCSCFGSGNENRTNKVKNKSKKLPAFPIFHAPNSKETIREPLKKRKKK